MCPMCMTTIALITASAASTGGITAMIAMKLKERSQKKERDHADE